MLRSRAHRCLDYELNNLNNCKNNSTRDNTTAADDGRSSAGQSSSDGATTDQPAATGQEKEETGAASGDDAASRREEESKEGLSWLQATLEGGLIPSKAAVHGRNGAEVSGILTALERCV